MFVQYFTHVALPIAEVQRRLDLVRNRLAEMADVAYRTGEELRATVSPWEEGFAKEVSLDLGVAEINRSGIAYQMTWTAIGGGILFPELVANLLLSHVGPTDTRLEVQGTYRPPLGVVGRVADRAVLGRFADAAVRHWLDRLATVLVDETSVSWSGSE